MSIFSKASKSKKPFISTGFVSTANPSRSSNTLAATKTELFSISPTRILSRDCGVLRARAKSARLFTSVAPVVTHNLVGIRADQWGDKNLGFPDLLRCLPPNYVVAGIGVAEQLAPIRQYPFQHPGIHRPRGLLVGVYGVKVFPPDRVPDPQLERPPSVPYLQYRTSFLLSSRSKPLEVQSRSPFL